MKGAAGARSVWLIRHAESEWNALGRWQGQRDPSLSECGREQAQRLARQLEEARVEAIIASDLRRARETAAIVGAALGVEPHFDARLRERDLGYWSGLTSVEIVARWPRDLARLREHDLEVQPGGGESLRAVHERVAAFVAALSAWPGDGALAVVTHAGILRALGIVPTPGNAAARSVTIDALRTAIASAGARLSVSGDASASGDGRL